MGKRIAAFALLLSILLTACARPNVVDSNGVKPLQEEVDMQQGSDVPWEEQSSQALYITSYFSEADTGFVEQPSYVFKTVNDKKVKTTTKPSMISFDAINGLVLSYDLEYKGNTFVTEFSFGPLYMDKVKDYSLAPGFLIGKYEDGSSDTALEWNEELYITINTIESSIDGDPKFLNEVVLPYLSNFSLTTEEPIQWVIYPKLALNVTHPDLPYWSVSNTGMMYLCGNDNTFVALYSVEPTKVEIEVHTGFRNLYYDPEEDNLSLADKDGIERAKFFYYRDEEISLASDVFVLLPKVLYYK